VQAQLLHLALAGPAPAIMVDPDFRITSCNEAAECLFGISAEDLTHEDIGVLFMNADDIHAILNHQFLFLSNGFHEETALLRLTSGQPASGRITALLLADEANQVVGFLVFIRQQPQPTNATEDLGIDSLMRQERLATMGEMAAQLAHEIRNPLLAIGATLESLATDHGPQDPDAEMLGTMAREVSRLDMILKDYLSLAARHNTHVSAVDLAEVLADIGRLLQGTRQQSGKQLHFEVPQGLAVVADYEGLKHVLFNLIVNALEASQSGGEVLCRAQSANDTATIFIEDRGGGLAAPADDCFKPFFTTKKHGTGLGLTVCKKIIASHGGTIALANRPGGGCQVTVVVPQGVSHERCSNPGTEL
jgi:signal transduction histidine kinase